VATAAIAAVKTEYQDQQRREALRKDLEYWMLFDATTAERQEAKEAAERTMAQVATESHAAV
jgi:hypothetical protein